MNPQALRKAEASAAAAEASRRQGEEARQRADTAFEEQLARVKVRAEPLGSDRYDRRYWWFPCACPEPCAAQCPSALLFTYHFVHIVPASDTRLSDRVCTLSWFPPLLFLPG